jgi:acid stress chaperone HdeB
MKRSLLTGFSFAALLISTAHAQVTVDVSKITCDQMRNKVANPVAVALWLNGYYAGKRNDATIDVISLDRKRGEGLRILHV